MYAVRWLKAAQIELNQCLNGIQNQKEKQQLIDAVGRTNFLLGYNPTFGRDLHEQLWSYSETDGQFKYVFLYELDRDNEIVSIVKFVRRSKKAKP